tara:strand:+ start:1227 stop:1607 length:381 start_codon:yes stop_codon:yes gene_type:complete
MKQYNILDGIDNLTEKPKMITREEYLKAVQLIQDYRVQINSEIDGLNLIHQEDLISDHLNMYVVNSLTRFSQSAYNNYGLNINRETKVKDFKINMPLKQIRRIGGLGGRGMEQLIEFCTKINIKLK